MILSLCFYHTHSSRMQTIVEGKMNQAQGVKIEGEKGDEDQGKCKPISTFKIAPQRSAGRKKNRWNWQDVYLHWP